MKPALKAPGSKRLTLIYNKLLSKFALNFNLRRYTLASLHGVGVYAADAHAMFCEGLLSAGPYISRCLRELALPAVCP